MAGLGARSRCPRTTLRGEALSAEDEPNPPPTPSEWPPKERNEPFLPGAAFADREQGLRPASPIDAFEPVGFPAPSEGEAQADIQVLLAELPGPAAPEGEPSSAPIEVGSGLPPPPPAWTEPTPSPFLEAPRYIPAGAPDYPGGGPGKEPYPMRFEVDYADHLSRAKTFFRLLLVIPAYLFVSLVSYLFSFAVILGWTTVFWRKKYPAWLFAAAAGSMAYSARVLAYMTLLTDKYPSLDQDANPVHLEFAAPRPGHLSRWRVLFWKLLLIIPHLVVLQFVAFAASVVVVLAWFAILLTGRYPRGMFAFIVGVMRWHFRVIGYFASFNDRFPPYALSADAGPASSGATVVSGLLGTVAGAGVVALIAVAAVVGGRPETYNVDYARLLQGRDTSVASFANLDDEFVTFRLTRVHDPGDEQAPNIKAGPGERLVVFEWSVDNEQPTDFEFNASDATLRVASPRAAIKYPARVVLVNGEKAPELIERRSEGGVVLAVFVLPADAKAVSLRMRAKFAGTGGIEYRFR